MNAVRNEDNKTKMYLFLAIDFNLDFAGGVSKSRVFEIFAHFPLTVAEDLNSKSYTGNGGT